MAEESLDRALSERPAVALLGPRQSGKTTLARRLSHRYYDLEQDADWIKLDLEWDSVVSSREVVAFDEAQCRPELFRRLRGAIDGDSGRCGRFMLLGSVSPALMKEVTESLAGRLALLTLSPLLLPELAATEMDTRWVRGGFPAGGILNEQWSDGRWQRDYLTLLAQRDLPLWGLPAKPQVTDRLLRMAASLHGQQWNASLVGQSLAVSYQTVGSYMDYLEGAYLVRALRPYHANMKKRLVKRPKYFWRDSGLLHACLNIGDRDSLLGVPWCGASWEGFAAEQILGILDLSRRPYGAWFFRTSDGYELDLVVETMGERWAFEMKLTTQPSSTDVSRLVKAARMVNADHCVLISRQADRVEGRDCMLISMPDFCAMWARHVS